jgi:hypothetical protein
MTRTVLASFILSLHALLGCQYGAEPAYSPSPGEDLIAATLHALEAVPWDEDPTSWGPACRPTAPCDTIFLDPRIVRLTGVYRWVGNPSLKPHLAILDSAGGVPALSHPLRFLDLDSCAARFYDGARFATRRAVCAAVGIHESELRGLMPADTLTVYFLMDTPANGQTWPTVRVLRTRHGWKAVLINNAGV